MQKIVGSLLIILASTGIGFLKGREFQCYLRELLELKRIFMMLKSEICYTKAPLGEAFFHIGKRTEGVFGTWLLRLGRELEEKTGKTFGDVWTQTAEESLTESRLKKSDMEQLLSLGMHMGYLGQEMQLGTIDLYLEQLEVEIQRARENMDTKKRLCNCLGVMGGIFLVVLFL